MGDGLALRVSMHQGHLQAPHPELRILWAWGALLTSSRVMVTLVVWEPYFQNLVSKNPDEDS